MLHNKDWSAIFAPNGVRLREGDTIQRTNFSRTLAIIAKDGPDAFHHGPIAEAIADKVQKEGGILIQEDIANYKVKVSRPLEGSYNGRKIYVPHAPTAGPVLLHMLNIMEHYDLVNEGRTALNAHRIVEAIKCGLLDTILQSLFAKRSA
jgi:gamma-glutamyltranspeptidase / glutathione hydrolase / leukotriene-C4 hydrolase